MSMLATTSSDSASCRKSQPVGVGPALFCIAVLIIGGALGFSRGALVVGTADAESAQPNPIERARTEVENLIARLRGRDMPEGIVKSNGRLEATEVDVAAKYPGRLATLTVNEGDEVTAGQVVATISSPETEAQLRGRSRPGPESQTGLGGSERAHSPAQERSGFRQNRL